MEKNNNSKSEFWNFLVSHGNRLLYDMDNYNFDLLYFLERTRSVDQTFSSFLSSAKFIAFEEEVMDEKKKSIHINELFDFRILEDFVNNNFDSKRIKISEFSTDSKDIINIIESNNNDARWIINTLKKCFSHGSFELDFERKVYLIENNTKGNELKAEVGFYWLANLGSLVNADRREIDHELQFFLEPYFYYHQAERFATKKEFIKYLKNDKSLYYLPLILLDGTSEEKVKAKKELSLFWNNVLRDRNIEEAMPDMTKEVPNGKIRLSKVTNDGLLNRIIDETDNIRGFYKMSSSSQINMLERIIYDVFCVEFSSIEQTNNIDYGLDLLINQAGFIAFGNFLNYCEKNKIEPTKDNIRSFADDAYNYGFYKKKIALAYFYGFFLFTANKDKIFDNYVDYESFDLSDITCYDYKKGEEVFNEIKKLDAENDLSDLKKEKLRLLKKSLIIDSHGTPAVVPNNKSFFRSIRNAISHKQIYTIYELSKQSLSGIDRDSIVLKNYGKFMACMSIDRLIELLTDKRFLLAIEEYEKDRIKDKSK
jgi:hypothetical protein